jgi:hypothetical protein
MIQIPGYKLEGRKDREDTQNGVGGGLLFYVKNCYEVRPHLTDLGNFNQYSSISLKTKSGLLHLILIYRPPSSSAENLNSLYSLLEQTPSNCIIIGDFNLPGLDWEENTATGQGRRLLDVATDNGLAQMVKFPTHRKGNILDLILTNCPDKFLSVKDVGCLGASDHCIIVSEIETGLPKLQPATITNWRKGNYNEIRIKLGQTNWGRILNNTDLKEAWHKFRNIISDLVDEYVPKKVVKGAGQPRWLTCEIKNLLNRKRKAWKRFKRESSVASREEYSIAARQVKKALIRAKKKVERQIAYAEDKNNRQFTRYVKSKTATRAPIGPIMMEDGSLSNNNMEAAEALNKYFASVFTKEDLSTLPQKQLETDNMVSTVTITEAIIIKKIKNLRADSAAGPDGIHPRLLKETAAEIAVPLNIIFNRSMRENVIPNDWKAAVVTPIFKKGTRTDPGNYRPVSLTSVPCKLLESIIKDKINSHLSENKLINESQHGFIKGRSCATNVIEFMEVVTKAVDKGDSADIFYLDFSKAFDKVPRERLMVKVRAKGITGELAAWLHNWLSDRVQVVKVQEAISSEQEVESGVPQGTVLGPCLFTIHIDDLEDLIKLIDLLSKFADDTKGLKIIRDLIDAQRLQEALDRLCEWADKWGMSFNVQKCKIMHVGRNNPNNEYFMNGTKLMEVEEEKDVGIIIHKSLKPTPQCERAAAAATGVLHQLAKNFHYRDKKIFLRLYTQYVRPHLEFATPAWSPWLAAEKQKLEKVQEKAVKMISGLKSSEYVERCKELGIETLEARRKVQDMAQTYKLIHGIDNVKRVELFNHVQEGRTRLAADPLNLRSELARTDIRKNFFTQRIVNDWNKIEAGVKNSKNVHLFK